MGVLYILLILALGYHHATNIPVERIKLKRSTGYGTYAHLALTGFSFIFNSLIVSVSIFCFLYLFAWLFDCFLGLINIDEWFVPLLFKIVNYQFPMIKTNVYQLLIICVAWLMCQGEIKSKQKNIDYKTIQQQDSILDIIIYALANQKSVKISLKSRKVYVGFVYSEQFEQVDLDNIVIIPLLSGARDKDSLVIHFDCNYAPVYKKLKVLGELNELVKFRTVLRVAEIESISMFDLEYFNDFEKCDISLVNSVKKL